MPMNRIADMGSTLIAGISLGLVVIGFVWQMRGIGGWEQYVRRIKQDKPVTKSAKKRIITQLALGGAVFVFGFWAGSVAGAWIESRNEITLASAFISFLLCVIGYPFFGVVAFLMSSYTQERLKNKH